MITSKARVAAKRVKSRVRPACGLVLLLFDNALEFGSSLLSALKWVVREDWSSCMLNHAAMADENHLDSLAYKQAVRREACMCPK